MNSKRLFKLAIVIMPGTLQEIKTIPYVPISYPFVEQLIGTIRREYLDQMLFWNEGDLQNKLDLFKKYYNEEPVHTSLKCMTPIGNNEKNKTNNLIAINHYRRKRYCGSYSNYQ